MHMLTSVLDSKRLSPTEIVKLYKMRWGIELDIRSIKSNLNLILFNNLAFNLKSCPEG